MGARIYLDTNTLVFMLYGEKDRVSEDARELITDYANTLHTSAACVHELLGLLHSGKVGRRSRRGQREQVSVVDRIIALGVAIEPITERHVRAEEILPWFDDHRDPIDRLIVAQAISDRATLLSSDGKFPRYRQYGLILVENTP